MSNDKIEFITVKWGTSVEYYPSLIGEDKVYPVTIRLLKDILDTEDLYNTLKSYSYCNKNGLRSNAEILDTLSFNEFNLLVRGNL